MKGLLLIVKILVLLSAGVLAVLRFVSFKYEASFTKEQLHLFLIISIVAAAVLVLSGGVWVLIVKLGEKGKI